MRSTHTDEIIAETCTIEGKEVQVGVRRRTPAETARLVRLAKRLNPEKIFTYRCTPLGKPMDLQVKAISLREAAGIGASILDELTAPRDKR